MMGQQRWMAQGIAVITVLIGVGGMGGSAAFAHTKGVSLSRYGLVDISWTGNLVYGQFTNYDEGLNPVKLGDRQFRGLTETSFDLSLSQDCFILRANFPCKWALFLTFEQDKAGIEEGFILFHKIPGYLQAKAGIFRVNFGKINQYHDHEWAFEDPPLVTTLFLGVDGVHNVGLELNWQPPTPIFTELSASLIRAPVGDFGGRTFPNSFDTVSGADSVDSFVFFSRATTFTDLTLNTNLELGASWATGRNKSNTLVFVNPLGLTFNRGGDMSTLYGLDFTYQWKPKAYDPYVRWTTEFMGAQRTNPMVLGLDRTVRGVDASGTGIPLDPLAASTVPPGLGQVTRTLRPSDTVGGLYTEVVYRFSYYWETAGRLDYVGAPTGNEDRQLRYSGNLRYYINPVSRIDVQYNYTDASGVDKAYSTVFVRYNIGGGTVTPGLGKFYNLF